MAISLEKINELRKLTGSGIMNCKKALIESDGDFDKAVEYLRKNGIKVSAKRSDCLTNEGIVQGCTTKNKDFGIIISIFCETDFVANSEIVKDFLKKVVSISLDSRTKDIEQLKKLSYDEKITIADKLLDLIGTLGEKLDIKYDYLEGESIFVYNHFNNKLSVLVSYKNSNASTVDAEKNIAMQIAAMNPVAIKREDVPQNIVDKELEIAKEQIQNVKDNNMAEKIARGKVDKYFKENVLYEQKFILDEKITINDYLKKNNSLEVAKFKRVDITK